MFQLCGSGNLENIKNSDQISLRLPKPLQVTLAFINNHPYLQHSEQDHIKEHRRRSHEGQCEEGQQVSQTKLTQESNF